MTLPPPARLTILFLAANPSNTNPLRLSEELRDIQAALRQADQRARFDLQQEWAVRIDDLRRALLSSQDRPLIVHFAGHGGEGAIYLEDNSGQARAVAGDALKNFFALFPNIQCVVLNACYSDALGAALAQAVPCVVGMQAGVQDAAAIRFATAFYDGVGAGAGYDRAFAVARSSLELEGLLESVQPIFRAGQAPAAPPAPPPAPSAPLPPPRLVKLTGAQVKQFQDALLDAFDAGSLAQMVRIRLDQNLAAIAGGSNLSALVFDLIGWAQRQGRLDDLLDGALAEAPGNAALQALLAALRGNGGAGTM